MTRTMKAIVRGVTRGLPGRGWLSASRHHSDISITVNGQRGPDGPAGRSKDLNPSEERRARDGGERDKAGLG